MAEFLTMEEAKNHFASNSKGNAGLTLGIIGTALGALGSNVLGYGNGNGILGLGGRGSDISGTMTGIAAGAGMTEMARQEMLDHEFSLVEMGRIQKEALKDQMHFRERDIAEKADIYRQSRADDNRINAMVAGVKEFATVGLSDVYRQAAKETKDLAAVVGQNKLEAYKDLAEVYKVGAISDKNLELQIERNRELDQREKFEMYKDLSGTTSKLAYDTMKQSYENRIENMNLMSSLAQRVANLETTAEVNKATLPLMFQLSNANTQNSICQATCRKIDGHLTLGWNQVSSPFCPFGIANSDSGCCGNN